jgi:hydroxyacylglutathione hydrolase
MHQLRDDVWHLPLTPRDGINAYLVGDVLIDAGLKLSAGKVVEAVAGHTVAAHALTHAHIDHAGGSKAVVAQLGVPVWAGAGDAADVRRGRPTVAGWAAPLLGRGGRFPAVPVDRELRAGDEVGPGFVVLDTPGHTPGHISFWRVADRTLICGDVLNGMHLITTAPGLREPPAVLCTDPAQNRASIRRLAELEPALVLFGHGPPSRDPAALTALAARLAP